MKSNLVCTCTLGVFLVCAVYSVWLIIRVYFSSQQLQQLQFQYARVEQTQEALRALAAETVEYGKKHPAIEPILQQYELKPRPSATNAPASPKTPVQ